MSTFKSKKKNKNTFLKNQTIVHEIQHKTTEQHESHHSSAEKGNLDAT